MKALFGETSLAAVRFPLSVPRTPRMKAFHILSPYQSIYRNPPHQQLRRNFSSRRQVPAVGPDLYDEPRKNTKRRAASSSRSSLPPVFEGDTCKGFEVRRVDLSKAPRWQIQQVNNTEFEEGWRTTFKFMEEFEKCSAHIPRFDGIPCLLRFALLYLSSKGPLN